MLNSSQLIRHGMNALTNNAPALLTAFGAVGVAGTAVLTAKASFEAADRIREAKLEAAEALIAKGETISDKNYNDLLTTQDKVKLVWPLYISAVSSGVLSCGAIVMSHRISSKRAAVLAAAYAMNESKLEEYQDKIKEKFGVKKEKEARDEIAQDKTNNTYNENQVLFDPMAGKVIIRDDYSGRYFYSTRELVDRAVNEINHEILMSVTGAATVSDFYDLLDLDHVSTSDHFGWNTDERLEIDWSTTTTPDGTQAVHSFEFVNPPVMNPGSRSSFR